MTPRFGDKYILDVLHMILQEYYRREAPLSNGETILSLNNFEYEIDELKKKKKKKKKVSIIRAPHKTGQGE